MNPETFIALHGRWIAEMLRSEALIAMPEYARRVNSIRCDLLDAMAHMGIQEYREMILKRWLRCSLAFNAGLLGALLWHL